MAKKIPANVISTRKGPKITKISNPAGNSLTVEDYKRITGKKKGKKK